MRESSRELARTNSELLAALARLRRSAQADKLFVAATSHDVRNALVVIQGYAELLCAQMPAGGPLDLAERIAGRAADLSHVVTELLQYAGLDQIERDLSLSGVSVRRLLSECGNEVILQCERKKLALEIELPEEAVIQTDAAKLTRIIQDLLSNAVRYTVQGGVTLRGELSPDAFTVRVTDSGIGIAPEDQARIFQELQRLEAARHLERMGTGLGLATARRLARALGGDIGLESAVGRGSTFWVTIPRALAPRAPGKTMAQPLEEAVAA